MSSRRSLVGLGLVVAVACTVAAAPAAAESGRARAAGESAEARTVPVAGMQVAIDPQTGRLRPPTPEESRQLLRALAAQFQPAKPLTATQWADGTLSVVLGEEHMSVLLARGAADGSVAHACVESLEGAARFLGGAVAAVEEK